MTFRVGSSLSNLHSLNLSTYEEATALAKSIVSPTSPAVYVYKVEEVARVYTETTTKVVVAKLP